MRRREVKLLIVSPSMYMVRQSAFCNSVTMGSFYCALVMTLPSCCYRWVFLMIEVVEMRIEHIPCSKSTSIKTLEQLQFLLPLLLPLDRYINTCWSAIIVVVFWVFSEGCLECQLCLSKFVLKFYPRVHLGALLYVM